jgi:Tfp pilus assembly protein PilF
LICQEQGKFADAETRFNAVLSMDSRNRDALFNLANNFLRQNKPGAAQQIYNKLLQADQNNVPALTGLGIALTEQKNFPAALAEFAKALVLSPDNAELLYNQGRTLGLAKRYRDAVVTTKQALAQSPYLHKAWHNLGTCHYKLGEFTEARQANEQALAISWNAHELLDTEINLLFRLQELSSVEAFADRAKTITSLLPEQLPLLEIARGLALYLQNKQDEAKQVLQATVGKVIAGEAKSVENWFVFRDYVLDLLNHPRNSTANNLTTNENALYILGESHCLSPAWTTVMHGATAMPVVPRFVMGCKAWDLAGPGSHDMKNGVRIAMSGVPTQAPLLIAIGEIDCRLQAGIIPFVEKAGADLSATIAETVDGYVAFIANLATKRTGQTILQNIPCQFVDTNRWNTEQQRHLQLVIEQFNLRLLKQAKIHGLQVLDVHSMTHGSNGRASGDWHLDEHHLLPHYLQTAWDKYLRALS